MASFSQGLAQGLSGLPQALIYRQDKNRKDAYRKAIAGLSSAEGPFDSEAAARVALEHGDMDSALGYRNAAADARARDAAAERQKGLDEIAAEDRTRTIAAEDRALGISTEDRSRKHATEDAATATSKLENFARRFNPHFEAGDTNAMSRIIAANPGLVGNLMNHGPGRRVAGVEKVQTPDGETRYAFQIQNARTGTTGPEQPGGSIDPKDNVVSYSQDEIERALQPFLPAAKADKPPTSIQELEYAKEHGGFTGGLEEWKTISKQGGVTVNLPGQEGDDTLELIDRAAKFAADGDHNKALALRVKAYGNPSADESKNYGFANRMDAVTTGLAQEISPGMPLDMIGANTKEGLKQLFPDWAANILASPEYRQYDQFKRDFINAQLRRESGAVISDAEFDNADKQYFPVVGDDAETIAQKRRNRASVKESIRAGAGRANAVYGYVAPQSRSPETPQASEPAVQPAAAPAAPQPSPEPAPAPPSLIGPAVAAPEGSVARPEGSVAQPVGSMDFANMPVEKLRATANEILAGSLDYAKEVQDALVQELRNRGL